MYGGEGGLSVVVLLRRTHTLTPPTTFSACLLVPLAMDPRVETAPPPGLAPPPTAVSPPLPPPPVPPTTTTPRAILPQSVPFRAPWPTHVQPTVPDALSLLNMIVSGRVRSTLGRRILQIPCFSETRKRAQNVCSDLYHLLRRNKCQSWSRVTTGHRPRCWGRTKTGSCVVFYDGISPKTS